MKYRESVIWLAVLVVLYFMEEGGPSLCLFKWVGLSSCPGCGLGHAIHEALHFQWRASWEAHIMGVPVTVALLLLIGKPFYSSKIHLHKHEPATACHAAGAATR